MLEQGWIVQRLRVLWTDEAAFKTALATWGRFLFAFVGYLIDQGLIPTGVAGGGNRLGMLMIVLAFLVNAGQKNPSMTKVLEQTTITKTGAS